MWKLARALVAASALAGPLGLATAAGAAQLALEHASLSVVEEAPANGIVSAGDTLRLTETVRSSEAEPLTGLSGVLSTTTAGVTVPDSTSPFADVAFGQTTANATPFRATLGTGVECGQNVGFSLALSTGPDGATIPVEVGTGAADAPVARQSTDVPHVIPNPGVLQSSLTVGTPGRVKDLRVRIGRLRHPYVQDLRITLVSPAGTRVRLFDAYGGSGDDLVDTVFASAGASLAGGSAPFTGTWEAPGNLSQLEGEQAQGTWKLEVTDTTPSDAGTLESWGTDLRPATCAPRPIAVVTATPNPAGVGTTVTFDGTQSIDPTGTIVMHEWDLDGNGSFETATGAVATVPHSYPTKQVVDAGLKITNDHGESSESRVTVRITAAPTAAFGWSPATPISGADVTLDGSASSDADGSIVHYAWDLDADGVFETGGPSATTVTAFATPGDKTVRLRVTDDTGATHTTARTITIANRPPDAAFTGPSPALVGEPAVLDMSASGDLDGFLIEQAWDFDDDGEYDDYVQSVPAPSPAAPVFATPGEHVVRLQVRDDTGATATVSRTIVVTHRPAARLVATPDPARPTKPVQLSAAGSSDADGTIVRYEWDLDGDGTFEVDGGSSPLRSTTFNAPGTATLRVRVTDDKGATDIETLALPVVNDMPLARLAAVPSQATAGVPVVLDASASADPDGAVTGFAWDLDANGSFETDTGLVPAVTRTFPNPGTITIRVRVTDDEAGTATASLALPVVAPASSGGGGGGGVAPPGGGGGAAPPGGGGVLPGPSGDTPPGAGSHDGGTGIAPGRAFTAALDGIAVQKLKTVLRRGVTVRCKADRAAVCRVWAELLPSDVKRLRLAHGRKARRAMAVSAPRSVAAGEDVALKLSARTRRALQRRRVRSVTVVIRGEAVAGSGRKIALARAVLVRR